MILDCHCHIDLYPNPEDLLKKCIREDFTVISMTNLPSHFQIGYPHFINLKRIRLALGMHPLYAELHNQELDLFFKNISRTSYIGEIGLDFSKEGISTKNIQITTFTKILEEVSNKKKLLSLHSRKAEKEVFEFLKFYKIKCAIFHWYSGPLSLIDQISEEGYFFSINPAMLNSASGRKVIERIPLNKLLTESDGPFTRIKGRVTNPSDISIVIKEIAKIKEIHEIETSLIIKQNFKDLLDKMC